MRSFHRATCTTDTTNTTGTESLYSLLHDSSSSIWILRFYVSVNSCSEYM